MSGGDHSAEHFRLQDSLILRYRHFIFRLPMSYAFETSWLLAVQVDLETAATSKQSAGTICTSLKTWTSGFLDCWIGCTLTT